MIMNFVAPDFLPFIGVIFLLMCVKLFKVFHNYGNQQVVQKLFRDLTAVCFETGMMTNLKQTGTLACFRKSLIKLGRAAVSCPTQCSVIIFGDFKNIVLNPKIHTVCLEKNVYFDEGRYIRCF